MPKLIHVSTDTGGRTFIGVDEEGDVWRGQIERDRIGADEYIAWKRIRSEFK